MSRPTNLTPALVAQIVADRQAGLTTSLIMRLRRVGYGTVCKICDDHQIPRRKPGGQIKRKAS